jgi:hypothetical protein
MKRQTVDPDIIEIVDDPKPEGLDKDITWRYRIGLERLKNKGAKVVFFIEDDDWYAPNYIEYLLQRYKEAGEPEIFGLNQSIYYHIMVNKFWISNHPGRASAMSTLVRVDAMDTYQWGADNDPWFDIAVWKQLNGKAIDMPHKPIAVGIKHGFGVHGGVGHKAGFHHYKANDPKREYLKGIVGEDINFYDKRTETRQA